MRERTKFTLSVLLATIVTLPACASPAPVPAAEPANAATAAAAKRGEPDYSAWNTLLSRYYNPEKGMDYRSLKAKDAAALKSLRAMMASVNPATLSKKEQLAYYINLYNINVVGVVVDKYPVKSIRDISTDPIRRLNVFEKDHVPFGKGKISLNDVENERIRKVFNDPRIHFAINCAAKSCPPIRSEAFVGAKLDAQLDDQARKFLNGPNGVKITKNGSGSTLKTTKIMEWFGDDFKPAGGVVKFTRKYLSADRQKQLGDKVKVTYDQYDWGLNDWRR